MGDSYWLNLPAAARDLIERRHGRVASAEHPSAGRHSDFSAVVHAAHGDVFVKGVRRTTPHAWMHEREARVNPFLPTLAPRLLWQDECDGWFLLGYECVAGVHADLRPGSLHLAAVAKAVALCGPSLTPCLVDVPSLAVQWEKLSAWRRLAEQRPALHPATADLLRRGISAEPAAVAAVGGDTLLHTDLHALNVLIEDDQARIIDWAWARRGAAFVDPGFLIIRLIDAGHDPATAEAWAASIPAWADAPRDAQDAFAVEVLGIWEYLLHNNPQPHTAQLTEAVRNWVGHRLRTLVA